MWEGGGLQKEQDWLGLVMSSMSLEAGASTLGFILFTLIVSSLPLLKLSTMRSKTRSNTTQ